MNKKQKEKWTDFFLKGGLLCLIGLFFSLYLKGFVLYGNQFGRKNQVIGATYMTLNNQFYDVLNSEIQQIAEQKGDHLITLDPALDQHKQNDQIAYLIEQNVDVLSLIHI